MPESLVVMIANGKIQEKAETAILSYGAFLIGLKKVDGKWKVTTFPSNPRMAPAIKEMGKVYERVAEDIESGKCRKAFDIYGTLKSPENIRIMQKALEIYRGDK